MPSTKPVKKPVAKKPVAKKPVAKKPVAKPDRAALEAAAVAAATAFDGDRVIPLLGRSTSDPELQRVIAELGYAKPIAGDVDLKKLGIVFNFEDGILYQVIFELRRAWTGRKRFPGRLPHGVSPDLATSAAEQVLAETGTGKRTNDSWYAYAFADHEVAMGFGKKLLETLFVIRKP